MSNFVPTCRQALISLLGARAVFTTRPQAGNSPSGSNLAVVRLAARSRRCPIGCLLSPTGTSTKSGPASPRTPLRQQPTDSSTTSSTDSIYWPNNRGWPCTSGVRHWRAILRSRELRHLLSSRRQRRSDRPGSSWTPRSDRGLVGVKLRFQASPNRRRKSARSGWNTDDLCSAERAKSLRSATNARDPSPSSPPGGASGSRAPAPWCQSRRPSASVSTPLQAPGSREWVPARSSDSLRSLKRHIEERG